MSACALSEERREPGGESVTCARCGLALERASAGYLKAADARVPDYPADGNELFFTLEDRSFWFRHRNRVILSVIERLGPAGAIWDIGGGNGYQAMALERAGVPCVLVEPGPRGCANAKARGVPVVVCARLEDLHLADGRIGGASFFDVLEHLDDPLPLLCEARRALSPGGRVYATVPAYDALWSDADDYAEHKTRYTAARLRALFEAAGLQVEYLSYYFQPLVAPIFLGRSVPSRLRRLTGRRAPATGADEHRAEGVAVRAIETLLRREATRITAGEELRWGASIIAVGARP